MNIETVFPVLCEGLLKSTALLASAALVVTVWRGSSAAARHLVWTSAMVLLIALPMTRLARPLWTVDLPAISVRAGLSPESAVPSSPISRPGFSASKPEKPGDPLPWRTMVIIIWLAGAAASLGYRAVGVAHVRRLRLQSRPLQDERIRSQARSVAEGSVWAERIELRLSPACRVPMAWGFWRPVVLLPDAALNWSAPRLSAALCHEFGHIRRRDGITRLLADVACAMYWMDPLAWLAARQLRMAQEKACDDLVLLNGANAADYAELLVQSARGFDACAGSFRHVLAMAQPSTLEARVRAIMDGQRNRRPPGPRARALGAVSVLAVAAASALAQVENRPDANGPQILISATFLEVADGAADRPDLQKLLHAQATLSSEEAAAVRKALEASEGADILSAPRVTTRSKQDATIRIGHEMTCTTEWAPGDKPGQWKPRASETKEVGISFRVTPELRADGTIGLDLTPEIVDFLGYVDLDDGKKQLPPSATAPEGHRVQPVFSSRKINAKVALKPGQTVVLGGSSREETVTIRDKVPVLGDIPLLGRLFRSEQQKKEKRQLWILVTAEQVKPGG